MSLLDDVSIVVTPNGYKAGELYAVIPVPTEGADVVTEGDFPSGTTTWNFVGGSELTTDGARINNTVTGINSYISQELLNSPSGKQFVLTYDVITTNGTTLALEQSSNLSLNTSTIGTNRELIFTWNKASNYLTIKRLTTETDVTIDNVILQELTSADMDVTRETAATRVDENGLVNYAEVIGGEEVTDVNFPSGTTAWTVTDGTVTFNNEATFDVSSKIRQPILVTGKTYKATYEVTENTGGMSLRFYNGGTYFYVNDSVGIHTVYFTALPSNTNFYISTLSGTSLTLKSISVKEVTRDNVPRIDYTGGGCPHILAEPQRTNFVVTSASGTYGSSPASEILAIAPDGENTAIRPVPSTSSNRYQETIAGGTYSSGDEVTYSWYRKRFSTPVVDSYVGDLFINALVNCTQVGVATEIISDVNGFNRVSATFSITDGSIDSILRFYFGSIIGDGNSSVAYWGHQLEVGSYATSYIPNFGTAAGVTRNQDIFTRDGIGSLINSTEGVLFAEIAALADDSTYRYMGLTDGSSDNRVIILYYNSSTRIRVLISSEGTKYFDEYYGVTSILDFHKVAVKWKVNDFALWIDGVERATDTSGLTPIGLNTLALDQATGNNFYGKVKQLQVYDTSLSDTQLAALTS